MRHSELRQEPARGRWRRLPRRWELAALVLLLAGTARLNAQTAGMPVGQTPGITLPSQAEGGDYLLGAAKLSTSFSDNVLLSSENPQSDFIYAIQPSFTVAKTIGWMHMTWDFVPGYVKYQRIAQRDRLTGAVVTDIDAKPTERWSVRVRNNYQVRRDPHFGDFAAEPVSTYFQGTGGGTILPLADQTVEEGNLDVAYQVGPATTLVGSFYFRDYSYQPVPGVEVSQYLVNSVSAIGRGQFFHQISPRLALGAAYTYQDISYSFSNHTAGVRASGAVGVGTFKITPAIQLQFFGGPDFSQVQNQILVGLGGTSVFIPVNENVTSGAGGVILALHKDRNSLQIAVTRELSGGTGFTAAAVSNKADLTVRHEFSNRWYGEISSEYAVLTPLGSTGSGFDIHALSIRAGLTHKFNQHFSIEIQAAHGTQDQTMNSVLRRVNVDFGMISLDYQIKHPIG